MSRRHIQLMNGILGPGGTDSYVVPAGYKVLLSSVVVSAETVSPVHALWSLTLNPAAGGPRFIIDELTEADPFLGEPWTVLEFNDVVQIENESGGGGPNIEYSLSGIRYDLP